MEYKNQTENRAFQYMLQEIPSFVHKITMGPLYKYCYRLSISLFLITSFITHF